MARAGETRGTSGDDRPGGRDTGLPATVRCRPDPDGIVIWVPDDEPPPDAEAAPGGEGDSRDDRPGPWDGQLDQG